MYVLEEGGRGELLNPGGGAGVGRKKMVSYLFFYWNALISCFPSGWSRRTKRSIVQ